MVLLRVTARLVAAPLLVALVAVCLVAVLALRVEVARSDEPPDEEPRPSLREQAGHGFQPRWACRLRAAASC